MRFASVNGTERPVRLCEQTRRFAAESLGHRYGLETKKTPGVVLDDVPGYEKLSDVKKYDAAVRRIALTAPVRICDGELVSGSATLGAAISHLVPALYKGEPLCRSISHLTVDFFTVVKDGIDSIRKKPRRRLKDTGGPKRKSLPKAA